MLKKPELGAKNYPVSETSRQKQSLIAINTRVACKFNIQIKKKSN